jgi:hypothetical protein
MLVADAEAPGKIMQIQSTGLSGRGDALPQSHQLGDGDRGMSGGGGIRVGRGWCRMVGHGPLQIQIEKIMTTYSANHQTLVPVDAGMG